MSRKLSPEERIASDERRRIRTRNWRKTKRQETGCHLHNSGYFADRLEIPPEVEADWMQRRYLRRQTLVAELMGDPEPGRSALDQRRSLVGAETAVKNGHD